MSFDTRLKRLEKHQGGRCPLCRNRPGQVLVVAEGTLDGPEPEIPTPAEAQACPGCGWQPELVEVVEVVCDSREDVARFEQRWGKVG